VASSVTDFVADGGGGGGGLQEADLGLRKQTPNRSPRISCRPAFVRRRAFTGRLGGASNRRQPGTSSHRTTGVMTGAADLGDTAACAEAATSRLNALLGSELSAGELPVELRNGQVLCHLANACLRTRCDCSPCSATLKLLAPPVHTRLTVPHYSSPRSIALPVIHHVAITSVQWLYCCLLCRSPLVSVSCPLVTFLLRAC